MMHVDTGPSEAHRQRPSEPLVEKILRALHGIRYGSVEIIVHEGRVVQIERKEKLRLDRLDTKER